MSHLALLLPLPLLPPPPGAVPAPRTGPTPPPAAPSPVPPVSSELCDLSLEYLDPPDLGLAAEDVPRSAWPRPRRQLPPFAERWTDYLRVAGPGVYVGAGMGLQRDVPPLHFVMAHLRTEGLD